MKAWVEAERLAEQIYRELLGFAIVKWNDHIPGVDSEIDRQIDVSIRWSSDGRDYLTIVQVKDWKNRPDVNDVGSFATVVEDVRATQGIMVSRKGFSKTAYTLARKKGIQLQSLHDAQSVRWRKKLTIPILWTQWGVEMRLELKARFDAGDSLDISTVLLIRDNERQTLTDAFLADWHAGSIPRIADEVRPYAPKASIIASVERPDGTRADRTDIDEFRCAYRATKTSHLGQFEPDDCRGVIDYLRDDSFYASHLPYDQIPKVRGADWFTVDNPDRIALDTRGTLVTMDVYGLDAEPEASTIGATFLHS